VGCVEWDPARRGLVLLRFLFLVEFFVFCLGSCSIESAVLCFLFFLLMSDLITAYTAQEFLLELDIVTANSGEDFLLVSDLVSVNTLEEGQLWMHVLSWLVSATVLTS
jgi:hypothetical protein